MGKFIRRVNEIHAPSLIEPLEPRRLLAATPLSDMAPPRSHPHDYWYQLTVPPGKVTPAGDLNLFSANDGRHGYELWRTDGTPAGTHMVADLVRGAAGSNPSEFVALGEHAFFFAGNALWRTDGTAGGTTKLQVDPGAQYFADPRSLTVFNGALYFADTDARGRARLWRSDGTAEGYTRLLQQGGRATASNKGSIGALHAMGDVLVFAQRDTAGEQWLWRSDGTPGGTFALHGGLYVFDHRLVQFGDELYFFGNVNGKYRGTALWRTDGTRAGTEIVKWFSDDRRLNVSVGVASAGTLYLRGYDSEHGAELWKSDGREVLLIKDLWTGAGETAIPQFVPEYEPPPLPDSGSSSSVDFSNISIPGPPPANSSNPVPLASTPRGALFAIADRHGAHVYHTDGTPEGTVHLPLSGPRQRVTGVQRIGDAVFIAVQSEWYDNGAIYVTDGTAAGTRLVWNASPRGTIHVHAVQTTGLSEVNGSLYFAGYTHETGMELMRLDDTGGITGYAYDDANGNGVRDLSELPLVGWRVFLDRNGDGVFNRGEKFTFADDSGAYGFPAYPDGAYTVRVVPGEAGWTSPAVAAPVQRGRTTWRDVSSARVTPVYGAISGNIVRDADFDGVSDIERGDSALEGVRVYLDLNRNGYYTRGEPQAFTDASGDFRFNRVLPGRYRLAVVDLGPGHQYTRGMERMLLVEGKRSQHVDFAIGYDGSNGIIHGVIFNDRDADGKQDANEPGLPGARIHLQDGRSAVSDSTGYYKFPRLRRGSYRAMPGPPPGGEWHSTVVMDLQAELSPGERVLQSWGYQQRGTASISGTVFYDSDGDGQRGSVDAASGGWWVYADLDCDGRRDPQEPSARTTILSGAYSLGGLLAGSYLIRFVPPDERFNLTHGAAAVEVNLHRGQARRLNAGGGLPGSVTGTIHYDRDGNRIVAGDPGHPGVTVYLDLNRNGLHDQAIDPTTVTDSNGRYRFDEVPAGTFDVVPVAPAGWVVTSVIRDRTVVPEHITEFPPMAVSDRLTLRGRLFIDRNGDGQFAVEEGLTGYTVYVDTDNDGMLDESEPRRQTSRTGAFVITTLPLGEHVVRFVPRADDPANVAPGVVTVTLPHQEIMPNLLHWVLLIAEPRE